MKQIIIMALSISLLTSCYSLKTPDPILYCQNKDTADIKWYQGNAIIEKTIDSQIFTYFHYLNTDKNFHYFKFACVNKSDSMLLIDPSLIFFTNYASNGTYIRPALNPNEMVLNNKFISEQRRVEAENDVIRAKNAAIVAGVITVAAATAIVVAENSSKSSRNKNDHRSNRNRYYNGSNLNLNIQYNVNSGSQMEQQKDQQVQMINQQEWSVDQLSQTLLKKTNIGYGEGVEGVIVYPIDQKVDMDLDVTIPITNSKMLSYSFSQRIFNPTQTELNR